MARLQSYITKLANSCKTYWRASRWHKLIVIMALLLAVIVGGMYGIAQWYIRSQSEPQRIGVSFIPAYAESLGVDPQQTMDELLAIGVRDFRLVSYWNQIEYSRGWYDFSQLDWQFKKAEQANANITLTLGLRQPRWPECHAPDWATKLPDNQWEPELFEFMTAVVERYRTSPALQDYQLENEFFLKGFGICTDHRRERLVNEYELVKRLDPSRTVVISRSNNAVGFPIGEPTPDEFGISIYKRVWDAGVTKRYLEYPFPAWFYAYLAGTQKLYSDRDMRVSELQAEAWPPNSKPIPETSLAEQNKSFNAARFADRVEYGKATGMRRIDLWGAEYWYYRMVKLNDPSLWRVAQQTFDEQRNN